MARAQPHLPWLAPGEPFPDAGTAWRTGSPAPGLLAAGGALDTPTLLSAYAQGIFPWYSDDQPVLWWSPDPRMVLHTAEFRLHRSLRKTLTRFRNTPGCEVRIDHDFATVIEACANAPREGQSGTWIVPDMVGAYTELHRAGHAHSVECWVNGVLAGGLYCVNIGGALFGESMFSRASDASKIALCALVALARTHGVVAIDCQQNTRHLASLGAREIPRADFVHLVHTALPRATPVWKFEPIYWNQLLRDPA